MGVFQNIIVQHLPISLIKFAVVNHWQGQGSYLSEVRILSPDRQHPIVVSQPTSFEIASGGFADNISFFVNVTFPKSGRYVVQTLIDSNLFPRAGTIRLRRYRGRTPRCVGSSELKGQEQCRQETGVDYPAPDRAAPAPVMTRSLIALTGESSLRQF